MTQIKKHTFWSTYWGDKAYPIITLFLTILITAVSILWINKGRFEGPEHYRFVICFFAAIQIGLIIGVFIHRNQMNRNTSG